MWTHNKLYCCVNLIAVFLLLFYYKYSHVANEQWRKMTSNWPTVSPIGKNRDSEVEVWNQAKSFLFYFCKLNFKPIVQTEKTKCPNHAAGTFQSVVEERDVHIMTLDILVLVTNLVHSVHFQTFCSSPLSYFEVITLSEMFTHVRDDQRLHFNLKHCSQTV